MASVKRYKTANGTAWRVQYRSPDGKSRTKQGFRTKDQAQKWANENAVAVNSGAWIDPTAGKTTISDLHPTWSATKASLKPKSRQALESIWKTHVSPTWGDRPVASIRRSEVTTWIANLNRSPSTARKALQCLSQILDLAVEDGMIHTNPAERVKAPKRAAPVKVYLTLEQLLALADECGEYRPLILLAGTVGLRWSELTALRVGDVDFLRRRIRVERAIIDWKAGEPIYGATKTHTTRVVAVPATVLSALEECTRGKKKSDLLWARRDGRPMGYLGHTSFFHGAVRRMRARDPEFPELTPHGLRHVAAGLMVRSGAHVKVVQRELGHASAAETLDTYSDLFEVDLDDVATAMDRAIADVVG